MSQMAQGVHMAGRRIDDHGSWIGKGSDGTVFPMGCKVKNESSAMGDGGLSHYEDTTEAIKAQQMENTKKMKSHAMRSGYRTV